MKKKVHICDICDKQFQTNPRGYRSFVGLEIHLKYEVDFSHKVLRRMHICPRCLDQIRQNSKKGE
jgi:hypothetical protein